MDLDSGSGVGVGRRPNNDAAAAAMREDEGEEDDEYDPFSTGPDQAPKLSKTPKDHMEAMIQIDLLLLGERSYFFEPDPGSAVKPDKAPSMVVDQASAPAEAKAAAAALPVAPQRRK